MIHHNKLSSLLVLNREIVNVFNPTKMFRKPFITRIMIVVISLNEKFFAIKTTKDLIHIFRLISSEHKIAKKINGITWKNFFVVVLYQTFNHFLYSLPRSFC